MFHGVLLCFTTYSNRSFARFYNVVAVLCFPGDFFLLVI